MSVPAELSECLRLCRVSKRDDFDGYGFNLHAEKGKRGQFVGRVDDDSPAGYAGLREGDRIIEVNGADVADENHKEVVQRIKALSERVELLVVDIRGDSYLKEKGIRPGSHLPFVVRLPREVQEEEQQVQNLKNNIADGRQELEADSTIIQPTQNMLNLNMTAQELRARLAARKKYDPKKDYSLDVKKKYDIIQKL